MRTKINVDAGSVAYVERGRSVKTTRTLRVRDAEELDVRDARRDKNETSTNLESPGLSLIDDSPVMRIQ